MIFAKGKEESPTRKRGREDDNDDDDDMDVDDDAGDYLGFAADSFVYRDQPDGEPMEVDSDEHGSGSLPPGDGAVDPQEGPSTRRFVRLEVSNPSSSSSSHPTSLRRSTRPKRPRKDLEYVYF